MSDRVPSHAERDRRLFDDIAATYCRKDRAPAARVARRQRLLRTLRPVQTRSGGRILEAGCGAGYAVEYLAGRFDSFVGVDHSEKLIDYATAHHGTAQVEFVAGSIEDLAADRPFDFVFMIGVLHHVEDMVGVLEHLKTLLKPGGWLAANEPQPGNPLIRMARALRTRVDAAYSPDQAQLSGADLRRVMADAGYAEVSLRPQGIFTTPFAEVVVPGQWLLWPAVHLACVMDNVLEATVCRLVPWSTWNLVCVGRRPAED